MWSADHLVLPRGGTEARVAQEALAAPAVSSWKKSSHTTLTNSPPVYYILALTNPPFLT